MKTLAIAVLVALLISVPAVGSAINNSWSNERLTKVTKVQRSQIRALRSDVRFLTHSVEVNHVFGLCNYLMSPEGSAFEGQQGERAEDCQQLRRLENRYPMR